MKFIFSKKGKRMPVDAEPLTVEVFDAKMILVLPSGAVVKGPVVGTFGYRPHWATCPDANSFGKRENK